YHSDEGLWETTAAGGGCQNIIKSFHVFLQCLDFIVDIREFNPFVMPMAGEAERAARGAAAGAGSSAVPQRGRGARPLAAQHSRHPQLCSSAPKRRHGYGGALKSVACVSTFFFQTYNTKLKIFCFSSSEGKRAASFRGATVQQDLYAAVSAASSWLDTTENHLLSGPVLLSEDTHNQLTHLESLNKQLKEMSREVKECRDWLHGGTGRVWGAEERTLIEDTLEGLQERMGLLDSVLEQQCDSIRDSLQEHTVFQNELRMLFAALNESKHQLLQKMAGMTDRPASKQLEVRLYELQTKTLTTGVAELRSTADRLQLDQTSNQELLKLQDTYEELVLLVGSRRSSLNQGLSLKAQYEAALRDLTELVDTAQDKMAADQKMAVASVIEVQMLLDKHREFFQFLERHMILTRTYFSKVSGLVAQRESHALEETMTSAFNVLKQAHRRGVELEGILESWRRFVEDNQALCKQLEAVESSIPTVGLVEETEDRITERISLYQVSIFKQTHPEINPSTQDPRVTLTISHSA
uniref:Uncharacterized protein n=1 Tax=Oryzias latipes TaxID=8090 RepID=A0A3P9KLI4_ORYLA